ncbi:MAG: type I glyceraldehyde-3-phosphate dehydrogenase [Verrucomicrobia subdivision 3 bacterium]|nr:type I glyceraldehyde-3-phosphate dehydrogenase [Limisphaerales bacterium]
MANVAINGLGRIGRAALKIILDTPELNLVAANDVATMENLAYLLRYDTVYGRYDKPVKTSDGRLIIGGQTVRLLSEKDPAKLPWKDLKIDLVFECTGRFTRREDLEKHLQAGASKVILSAPSKSEEVVTAVHGVNHPEGNPAIISCASCTTNCIAPVAEIMSRRIGVTKAVMTTVHAYTADQSLVDGPHKTLRRGRAGAANLVPTSTGAALATVKILPQYRNKFDGLAVRVPVTVGSLVDLVFVTERRTTVEEVNRIFTEEAEGGQYQDILGVTNEPFVSSDIIKDPRASIVDLGMTQVVDGDLVKILSWYDNEWGYVSQMIRHAMHRLKPVRHQHNPRRRRQKSV